MVQYRRPERPWWQRKRWLAALLFWMLFPYPLSIGPAAAFTQHGRIPVWVFVPAYTPLIAVSVALGVEKPLDRYCAWCADRLGPN